MHMSDWIDKLDDFLKLADREVLRHAGKVSHDAAAEKARLEYERFTAARAELPTAVDEHFEHAVGAVKRLEDSRRLPFGARKKK